MYIIFIARSGVRGEQAILLKVLASIRGRGDALRLKTCAFRLSFLCIAQVVIETKFPFFNFGTFAFWSQIHLTSKNTPFGINFANQIRKLLRKLLDFRFKIDHIEQFPRKC